MPRSTSPGGALTGALVVQGLALMEIKLITACLLHSFDFELAVPHAGGYESTLVLPMRPGLMVRLTPRR